MIAGILFILAGILIAIYPPVLTMAFAALLVMLGAMIMVIAYRQKRLRRHFESPAIEFILRI